MDTIIAKLKKNLFQIATFLVCGLYLYLRLSFPDTIEFGYDQPRLSTVVVNFINDGSYITSQEYSLESPWGNLSWGPSLVYILAPIFLLTKNPLFGAYLMIFLNILTILLSIKIGKDFFSKRVGIVAGVIMATHPWWIIFSRMIYQPTIVPLLMLVSIYCLFVSLNQKNSLWPIVLFASFGVLIQTYLITSAYIMTALLIIFVYRRDIYNIKNLSIGFLTNLILFLPSIYFYTKNQELFWRFFEAKDKYISYFDNTLYQFADFFAGGGLKWQLGYGYSKFVESFSNYNAYKYIFFSFFVLNVLLSFYTAVKKNNKYLITALLIFISPLWFIPLVGVEYIVPRYFLYCLPVYALLVGVNADRFKSLFLIPTLVVCALWIYIIINYFNFVIDFSYKEGFLSHYSDVPYSFLDKSFKWIKEDSAKKGYESFTVSSDINFPTENRLNWAQSYYWNNVLNNPQIDSKSAHYLMYFSPVDDVNSEFKQIGPYIISEFKN